MPSPLGSFVENFGDAFAKSMLTAQAGRAKRQAAEIKAKAAKAAAKQKRQDDAYSDLSKFVTTDLQSGGTLTPATKGIFDLHFQRWEEMSLEGVTDENRIKAVKDRTGQRKKIFMQMLTDPRRLQNMVAAFKQAAVHPLMEKQLKKLIQVFMTSGLDKAMKAAETMGEGLQKQDQVRSRKLIRKLPGGIDAHIKAAQRIGDDGFAETLQKERARQETSEARHRQKREFELKHPALAAKLRVEETQRQTMAKAQAERDPTKKLDILMEGSLFAEADRLASVLNKTRGSLSKLVPVEIISSGKKTFVTHREFINRSAHYKRIEPKGLTGSIRNVDAAGNQTIVSLGDKKTDPAIEAAIAQAEAMRNFGVINFLIRDINSKGPKGRDLAFGFRSDLALMMHGFASQLVPGTNVGNNIVKAMMGGTFNATELQSFRVRGESIVADSIPDIAGDESGRFSDIERRLTANAIGLLKSAASGQAIVSALSEISYLRVFEAEFQNFKQHNNFIFKNLHTQLGVEAAADILIENFGMPEDTHLGKNSRTYKMLQQLHRHQQWLKGSGAKVSVSRYRDAMKAKGVITNGT